MHFRKRQFKQYRGSLKSHRTMTIFVTAVIFLFIIFASSLVISGVSRSRAEAAEMQEAQAALAEARLKEQLMLQEKKQKRDSAFSDIDLRADGAIVFDINSGHPIFEKNADRTYPLASITKVMTIVTASDYLSDDTPIYIDSEAISTEGESGLLLGETWSFKELADLTMIVSSNDGAVAIAKAAGAEMRKQNSYSDTKTDLQAFVEKMNEKASEIGLKNAVFQNPSGLDLEFETVPSAIASPRGVARLLEYALAEELALFSNSSLGSLVVSSLGGREISALNTNEAAGSMPGLMISKTGNTLQAGGTLGVVVDMGVMQPVAIVVLGSTIADRVGDVDTLYNSAKIYFENL